MKKALVLALCLALGLVCAPMAIAGGGYYDGCGHNPPPVVAPLPADGKIYVDTWNETVVSNSVGVYKEKSLGIRCTESFDKDSQAFFAANKTKDGLMVVDAGKTKTTTTRDAAVYVADLVQNFNNLAVDSNIGFTGGASTSGPAKAGVDVAMVGEFSGAVCTPGFTANVYGKTVTNGYANAGK